MKPVVRESSDVSKQEDFTGPTYSGISNLLHDAYGVPRRTYHLKKSENTGNIVLDFNREIGHEIPGILEKLTSGSNTIDIDHTDVKDGSDPKLLD